MQSKLNIAGKGFRIFSLKNAVINFSWAYILVTILAYGISMLASLMFDLPSNPAPGKGIFESPEFVKTVPYHLLINLILWTAFSYIYFTKTRDHQPQFREAIFLGCFWLLLAMIVDLVFFVLITSPVSLTFHQFYIEYQPWITITYFLVLISPPIGYYLFIFRQRTTKGKSANGVLRG